MTSEEIYKNELIRRFKSSNFTWKKLVQAIKCFLDSGFPDIRYRIKICREKAEINIIIEQSYSGFSKFIVYQLMKEYNFPMWISVKINLKKNENII
jgi:hypothetical protein